MSDVKMYKKSELEYKGGYIVKGDKVIAVDNEIVDLLNKLDTDIQRAEFEAMKESFQVDVSDMNFNRVSERGCIYPYVKIETPVLDKLVKKTEALMDEFDNMGKAEQINKYFASIKPLIMFVSDDFVIAAEHGVPHRFDLPVVGNPLELTSESLGEKIMEMFA